MRFPPPGVDNASLSVYAPSMTTKWQTVARSVGVELRSRGLGEFESRVWSEKACEPPNSIEVPVEELVQRAGKLAGYFYIPERMVVLPIEDRPIPPPNMPPVSDAPPQKKRKPAPEIREPPKPEVEVRLSEREVRALAKANLGIRKGISLSLWAIGLTAAGVGAWVGFGSVKGVLGFMALTALIFACC